MNAILFAHRLDQERFRKCARFHEVPRFRVIGHGDVKPLVITVTKTEHWDSEPSATDEILKVADCERCESLCMTHFGFMLGKFPEQAFRQCLASLQHAVTLDNLQRVVVDVDERYFDDAVYIWDEHPT